MSLTVTTRSGIANVTLDRPGRRNAMLASMWQALPKVMTEIDADPAVSLVVLRGSGGHFGAGNDIADFLAHCVSVDQARSYAWAMAAAMRSVEALAKPIVAAIEGDCYGASVALTLACDLRVAADNAGFAITPAKLGVLYLSSDLARLSALIGPARVRDMIFTARRLDAREAQNIGLVDRLLPHAGFEEGLVEVLRSIAIGSPVTIRGTKAMLRRLSPGDAPPETEETIAGFVAATQGADFKEGAQAFLEKRRPNFVHG